MRLHPSILTGAFVKWNLIVECLLEFVQEIENLHELIKKLKWFWKKTEVKFYTYDIIDENYTTFYHNSKYLAKNFSAQKNFVGYHYILSLVKWCFDSISDKSIKCFTR